MKQHLLVLGALAVSVGVFVACAEGEPTADAPADPVDVDGGALAPGSDAATPDAAEAGDADAAPRECSKEGFCHTSVPPNQSLRGVWSDDAGTTWAVSKEGAILRYEAGTWSVHQAGLGELFSIWGSGPTDIWVGGEVTLFHGQGASSSTVTFTSLKTPGPSTPITSIWGTGPDDVWATGGANQFPLTGRVLHLTGGAGGDDAGAEWTLEDAYAEPIWLLKVFGSKASGVWLAGTIEERDGWSSHRRAAVLRRSVGDKAFVPVDLPRDPDFADSPIGDIERLTDAAASADGLSMWVLGRTGGSEAAYLRATTNDGGSTFTWAFAKTGTGLNPELYAVGAVTPDDAFVVGDYGRLRHWDGASWRQSVITVTKFPVTAPLYALGGRADDLWFVGDGIAIHRDPTKVER